MITHIYGSSNASTRKAVKWFKDKNITFVYRNIIGQGLIVKDVRHILSLTKNGTDDILSTKSHDYQNLNLSLADLSLEKLCQYMIEFPNIVRTQIGRASCRERG